MRCAAATLPGKTSISPAKSSSQKKITIQLQISSNTKMESHI
jgi:hypothetical protein